MLSISSKKYTNSWHGHVDCIYIQYPTQQLNEYSCSQSNWQNRFKIKLINIKNSSTIIIVHIRLIWPKNMTKPQIKNLLLFSSSVLLSKVSETFICKITIQSFIKSNSSLGSSKTSQNSLSKLEYTAICN